MILEASYGVSVWCTLYNTPNPYVILSTVLITMIIYWNLLGALGCKIYNFPYMVFSIYPWRIHLYVIFPRLRCIGCQMLRHSWPWHGTFIPFGLPIMKRKAKMKSGSGEINKRLSERGKSLKRFFCQ